MSKITAFEIEAFLKACKANDIKISPEKLSIPRAKKGRGSSYKPNIPRKGKTLSGVRIIKPSTTKSKTELVLKHSD